LKFNLGAGAIGSGGFSLLPFAAKFSYNFHLPFPRVWCKMAVIMECKGVADMKKLLSVTLVIVLILGLMPITGLTAPLGATLTGDLHKPPVETN